MNQTHAGFSGKISLEVFNHSPWHLEVRPNVSRLCQLIFEEVDDIPTRSGSKTFSQQDAPLGASKPR